MDEMAARLKCSGDNAVQGTKAAKCQRLSLFLHLDSGETIVERDNTHEPQKTTILL